MSAAGSAAAQCKDPLPPAVRKLATGPCRGQATTAADRNGRRLWSYVRVFTRAAAGRARVVREIRASAPLMAALRAPVPARGPWLTAVVNGGSWSPAGVPRGCRPVAVVVEEELGDRPVAAAFLVLRRRVRRTVVTLLGQGSPVQPDGRPPARLLARDGAAADLLAAGIVDLLGSLGGPWTLELHGLPLGDPTLRRLASTLPGSVLANVRSRRLVDELDAAGPPLRSRDPRVLERWLPELLPRVPDPAARRVLRATARLHVAIDQLEVAVIAGGGRPQAALLTLVDGADRWPWWGFTEVGGLRTEMGAPLVTFSARGGRRPRNGTAARAWGRR